MSLLKLLLPATFSFLPNNFLSSLYQAFKKSGVNDCRAKVLFPLAFPSFAHLFCLPLTIQKPVQATFSEAGVY